MRQVAVVEVKAHRIANLVVLVELFVPYLRIRRCFVLVIDVVV